MIKIINENIFLLETLFYKIKTYYDHEWSLKINIMNPLKSNYISLEKRD